ncbi:MAG: hypothetical protein GY786_11055 [Proteobacteria bacterium]|nr:hypothetical protein [Pseudomonadota bacterium]
MKETTNEKKLKFVLLSVFALFLSNCSGIEYVGSEHNDFKNAPKYPISISKAIEISKPYLDETFKQRSAKRSDQFSKEPVVWVSIKGDWYYIVKDNYSSYTPGFYLNHAVKIHKETGQLVKPENL